MRHTPGPLARPGSAGGGLAVAGGLGRVRVMPAGGPSPVGQGGRGMPGGIPAAPGAM